MKKIVSYSITKNNYLDYFLECKGIKVNHSPRMDIIALETMSQDITERILGQCLLSIAIRKISPFSSKVQLLENI